MSQGIVTTYEDRLSTDGEWAMSEGGRHFNEQSDVHKSLRQVTRRLNELGVPYAVIGGMALFRHGFRRFTEDIDILVSKDGLKLIHEKLSGRGYLPPFERSKHLRDTTTGVRIEFLVSGAYPGDGKEKPIAFPEPGLIAEEHDGVNFANINSLIELKLASGMSGVDRMKDLADVQELIKLLTLPRELATDLHDFVADKYTELWDSVHAKPKRYLRIWRNKFLTLDATSLEDMTAEMRAAAELLKQMLADGVVLDPNDGTADDYAYLVTTDPEIAKKYDMHNESEFME